MTTDLRTLARSLGGEISAKQLLCPGPGHSAADRSLSIKIESGAPDGFVVHSFAGDDPIVCRDYVRQKLGLPAFKPNGGNGHGRASSDAIERALMAAVQSQRAEKPKGQLVATFDYTDENGQLLYQVLKYDPKDFRQRRPNGNGGFIWSLGDVRRVPYRWPELLKYPDATIFICEGEKDADNVAALDLTATTVASGKWTDDCVQPLKGRDCWIVQDCDEPGKKKALAAAAALHGIAKSIKIVHLPGLTGAKDNKDVSNWLDRGHTKNELIDVCTEAPDWSPSCAAEEQTTKSDEPASDTTNDKRVSLPFIDMSRWDDEEPPPREWAVPERIPLLQTTLFSGEGGAGKSNVELHQCVAHVLGRDWLETLPELGPAIFVECEDEEKELRRRAACVLRHYETTFAEAVKSGLHMISFAGHDAVLATLSKSGKIEPTPIYKELLERVGDIKPKMIAIASSANVYAGSESDRGQVQQFIGLTTRLALVSNGAVVLVSHPSITGINSDTGLSGTTQWHNAVRARMYMKSINPEQGEQPDTDLREIVFKKSNYGPISTTIVVRYQNGLFLPVPGVTSLTRAAQEQAAESVFLDLLKRFTAANRNVSDRKSPTYAPALFAREDEARKAMLNSKALEVAMRRLFSNGKIWNESYGKPSRQHFHIAIKE